jgi:hypothetical protein
VKLDKMPQSLLTLKIKNVDPAGGNELFRLQKGTDLIPLGSVMTETEEKVNRALSVMYREGF